MNVVESCLFSCVITTTTTTTNSQLGGNAWRGKRGWMRSEGVRVRCAVLKGEVSRIIR